MKNHMTVAELIEKLETLPPDAKVVCRDWFPEDMYGFGEEHDREPNPEVKLLIIEDNYGNTATTDEICVTL